MNFRNRRLTEKIKQESWWQRQLRKALSDDIKIIWLLINVSVRSVENLVFMARLFRSEHQITVKWIIFYQSSPQLCMQRIVSSP